MQTQNGQLWIRGTITMAAITLVIGLSAAAAQTEDANTIFASAPKVATSVDGIRLFMDPPKGFNPLTATNVELLTYGLPQRPDQVVDPAGYKVWERAMLSINKTRQGRGTPKLLRLERVGQPPMKFSLTADFSTP